MLKEAIEAIKEMSREADAGTLLPVKSVRRKSLLIHHGTHEWLDNDPPTRQHKVESLDSLIAIATRFKETCSIWHAENAVSVMIDDQWRDDEVTFILEKSSAWHAAMKLKEPRAQGELIDLCRMELKDVVMESHPELIALFKNVKFKRRDESGAVIDHGRESLGRELEQQVTGTDKLPEEISLMLRPYVAVESESAVRFAMKISYQQEKFSFRSVGDDVSNAIDAAQNVMAERFEGVTDKVYYGTP